MQVFRSSGREQNLLPEKFMTEKRFFVGVKAAKCCSAFIRHSFDSVEVLVWVPITLVSIYIREIISEIPYFVILLSPSVCAVKLGQCE